jgi:hypothetical protein
MAGKVGIANVGLQAIGGSTITSFNQGTKNANVVNDIYEELRRNLLSYAWNFATNRVELARSTTVPAYQFEYAYVLPSDWIYTVSVHENDLGAGTTFYKSEQVGGQTALLSDSENLYLRYVKDEDDPNLMPADFRFALSMALARDMSIPIANSVVMYDKFEGVARKALIKAKATDAQGSFPESRPRGSWADSRNGLRGNSTFRA